MFVVSFHGYKGGSGCSTTIINTLPFLVQELNANANEPILVIDVDIDSAGLTYLLAADQYFEDAYDSKSLLGGNLPGRNIKEGIKEHPFFSNCLAVGEKVGVENEAVYFLGIDDKAVFETNDMVGSADRAMHELRRLCRDLNVKAIIFDTATGEQFSSVLTNQLTDVIVCCLRPTQQSRMGTSRYLQRIESMMMDMSSGEQIRNLVVLPVAVPQNMLILQGNNQYNKAIKNIQESFKKFSYEVNREFIIPNHFGIPEVERFKWQESVLYCDNQEEQLNEEETFALSRYQDLAKVVINEGQNE